MAKKHFANVCRSLCSNTIAWCCWCWCWCWYNCDSQVTQDIESILKPKGFALTKRGTIAVKGKGDMVTTIIIMVIIHIVITVIIHIVIMIIIIIHIVIIIILVTIRKQSGHLLLGQARHKWRWSWSYITSTCNKPTQQKSKQSINKQTNKHSNKAKHQVTYFLDGRGTSEDDHDHI